MRFVILSSDYPAFLNWHYSRNPGLEGQPYAIQLRARRDTLFGVADFYSTNLEKLGHEAAVIHVNAKPMQRRWWREQTGREWTPPGVVLRAADKVGRAVGRESVTTCANSPILRRNDWMGTILAGQIEHYRPDVILNQALDEVGGRFLRHHSPTARLRIAQHASRVSPGLDLERYDLLVSSLPNLVERFQREGRNAVLHRLAFEPSVLERSDGGGGAIPFSFVGSFSRDHEERRHLVEHLCQATELQVWGTGELALDPTSPIHQRHRGAAWGSEMYRILRRSRITLNQHIDIAGSFANNCRLYEATGSGAMLLTDWKANLHEMFQPGVEVVPYRSPEEALQLARYYLAHEEERSAIARAGQTRTLSEHTYERRMAEFLEIVERRIVGLSPRKPVRA